MRALSRKLPEMSDKDWVKLDVSQELKRTLDFLGGSGGRVEVTARMQRIAIDRAKEARQKLKDAGIRDKELNERIKSIERLASLRNDVLHLYFDMVRSKGQKLRVTKSIQREAQMLVDAGHARYSETAAGTCYIKPPWTENPSVPSIADIPSGTRTLTRSEVLKVSKVLKGIGSKLPRMGYCVRLPDGREVCRDRRGLYLIGHGHLPAWAGGPEKKNPRRKKRGKKKSTKKKRNPISVRKLVNQALK